MKKLTLIISVLIIITSINVIGQSYNDNQNSIQNNIVEQSSLYRITPPILIDDFPRDVEIVGGNPKNYHDLIIDKKSIDILLEKGYQVEEIIKNFENPSLNLVNQYRTFEEIISFLESINQNHPEITSLFSIGKSIENRDIWCLEISDNPGLDENEPEILYLGLHHAREWPTIEICLQLAEDITKGYIDNNTIQQLVNNRRIWIIPCVNPDGYVYDHDINQGTQWWRKNRQYIYSYDTYGIDLNRNYGGSTNGDADGMWGSLGMSHNPTSELYCGTKPFSEPEVDSIKEFFLSHDICSSITWHTSGELVMWPWGYSTDIITPHNEYISEVGKEIASRITKQSGIDTYDPTQAAELYPTAGDTTDWMYGYSHYVKGKPCFAYTIEACTSFHPDQTVLEQVCKENVDGALYLLNEAIIIDDLQPMVLPIVIDNISEVDENLLTISWENMNPLSDSIKYEIQEYYNLNFITDNADQQTDSVYLEGFTISNERSQSGSNSYYAHFENNLVSAITSVHPLYINKSMDLSFYCWYEIEKDYDKSFVEISTDGRNYEVIDMFTGSSGGWILREYSLDKYMGKSVFFRFRYSTDDATLSEGFYVDDIFPIASYEMISSLNDDITQQYYTIQRNVGDQYYYNVRGYNELFGWGDYGMLKPIGGTLYDNIAPNKPSIIGPKEGKPGELCYYEINSIDPDDNQVYYYISWGDGSIDEWIGPFNSGEEQTVYHTWEQKGDYTIEIRSKDIFDAKSEWTNYQITLQKAKFLPTIWEQIISFFSLFSFY